MLDGRLSSAWRVAVIGGGVSGLAAAYRLQELCRERGRALDLTLLESAPRCGGVAGTERIGGYTIERGPDSFITNKPGALNLCRRLGLADRLISTSTEFRGAFVLRRGKLHRVPDGFNLLTPSAFWPMARTPILSWRGKLRMACELFLRSRPAADESLASFVRRRFGQEALERLVQPLVGGIYTSDPERLSLAATLPRFLEMERQHGSLIRASLKQKAAPKEHATGARYGLFMTLAGGIGELFETLSQKVAAAGTVRLNTRVTAVRPAADSADGWTLTLSGGEQLPPFDAVVVALPAPRAAEVVAETAPDLAAELRQIEYASSAIVVTGHPLTNVRHPLDGFGLVIPHIERRRILAVSFTSRKFPDRAPAGCVQLRTFVGGALQPEIFALSDDELRRVVLDELRELLGVTGEPDVCVIARYPGGMPQYHVGHLDRVARIAAAARRPTLALCGNAYHGVGLPDCIQDAERAADELFARARPMP